MAVAVAREPELFVFGPFALDAFARTLTAHERPVTLQPKTFELLAYLVRNPGRLLTKDELIDALWCGGEIGEGNLSQQVFLLRGTLARCAPRASFVVTEPGRGYRFVARVATRDDAAIASAGAEPNRLYARGRYFLEQRTAAGLERSIAYFRRAIAADPCFGRAHAGLASAHALCGEYLLRAPDDAFPAADAAAREALQLDEASAEACIALGDVACFYEQDLAAADRLYRQAFALAPAASNTNAFRAWFLCVVGRADDAAELLEAAVAREPYSLLLQTTRAVASIFRREYDEAVAQLRAVLDMDAEYVHARYYLAVALHLRGAYAQAALVCADPMPDGYEQQLLALRGASFARLGNRDEARAALDAIRALARRGRYVSSYNLACVQLALDWHDTAVATLEHGFAERDPWLVFIPEHPQLDALRGDARFRALTERVRGGVALRRVD
ncbi:MAG TPA: winged helix-turn-helix domain-containing protein [Candidatus Elarobacter sp.]|jgi:DNA-binding winged helix-turn-helix (wHTH) protein/Tfp pilus assembly protein PilF